MMKMILMAAILAPMALAVPDDLVGSLPNSAPSPGLGDKGVADGSCWGDSDGNRVAVDLKGRTTGDQEVKLTSGDETGKGVGTPADDDGCRESSEIKLGDDWFQIKKGKLQRRSDPDDAGSYKDMKEKKDDECADDEAVPD